MSINRPETGSEAERLRSWLEQIDYPLASLERLSGDVSPRQYFRVESADPHSGQWNESAIAVAYPLQMLEMMSRFEATTRLLEGISIRVPRILDRDTERGLMLLEDFGTETLFDLRSDRADHLRFRVVAAARLPSKIQRLATAPVAEVNPPLDEVLFRRELDQTWQVYLQPEKGLDPESGIGHDLAHLLDDVCRDLSAAPRVACHRDLMARNLMPLPQGQLGVLDHQDLRLGPRCYDLASLLNDSLDLSIETIESILDVVLNPDDRRTYLRCVVQRCFKIAGTFYRFAERGEDRYLSLVPKTVSRALDAAAELLPDQAALVRALRQRLIEID